MREAFYILNKELQQLINIWYKRLDAYGKPWAQDYDQGYYDGINICIAELEDIINKYSKFIKEVKQL